MPAIAYVKGLNVIDLTMSEGFENNIKGSQDAYVVNGDVSMEYAIETISNKDKGVLKILGNLKKGFYNEFEQKDH